VIALDTNVLVRYLTEDDPGQTQLANDVLDNLSPEEPGWISVVVLAELVWSLRRTYKLSKDQVVRIVSDLVASKDVVIDEIQKVERALSLHRACRAGFADCLLAVSAAVAGCSKTVTFDKIAARDLGMELLGSPDE
jgi:predicted nucleic-acid-binding protein